MRPKPPRPLEREIQANGIAALAMIGIRLFRRNVALRVYPATETQRRRVVRSAKPGMADTYGWHIGTGLHVEIEWKRPEERPTQAQLDWLWKCGQDGAIAFWSDSPAVALRVVQVCLEGGKIHWLPNGDFDVRRTMVKNTCIIEGWQE